MRISDWSSDVCSSDLADLAVDAQDPEPGIDEHPLDLLAAEDREVEDQVDDDRDPAVHVQERDVAVRTVGEHEAGDAEHQHVEEEERIDENLRHARRQAALPPSDRYRTSCPLCHCAFPAPHRPASYAPERTILVT